MSDSTKRKVPTTTEVLRAFVDKQHEEALKDANRAPDASPWRLVQLAGIKKILKAYELIRETLVERMVEEKVTQEMTIDDRNTLEATAITDVDAIINKKME